MQFRLFAECQSFGTILARNRGVGPGFDLLRILLALSIFYGHALTLGGALQAVGVTVTADANACSQSLAACGWAGPKRPMHVALVPMFFALSGFLVAGSALRLPSVSTFLANRFLRIFPALVVELTLSAFVLGAIFTTLPLSDYYRSAGFWDYFSNTIGIVNFSLPGVFGKSPLAGIVNVNLWTLPAEFDCYLIMAVAMTSGMLRRRTLLTAIVVSLTIVLATLNGFTDFAVTPTTLALHTITYYFFVGTIFYLWRDRIPFSWLLFEVSCIGSYLLLLSEHTVYLAAPFVTYWMVFFGMVPIPKIKLISRGDYSYGIYLYGFPISQAVITAVPALEGHWWIVFGVAFILTATFSALSWHFIEKPTLALKRHLSTRWFPTGREFAANVGQPTQRPVG
jgi:peptidoglycan/LPS O-acetylase OafA/YrhL